ncbi:SH3 domain-binding glutamic acid-rich-like protein 3 [Betta splendens]|uniref:SH3 domain-binding glutamic acid-rich-like protein 3 n=1 Tax=Betta splendens TaxID=158456 RepID=A0A6P7LQW8_BETSP|nr:SH3 domain-binding glutamic acid-rich-like protein 3 [Betta splendens]
MSVTLFITNVSSSVKIKKEQERIINVLESKKIPFKCVDISQNNADKDRMREIAGNPTALPPQISNDKHYCGDFNAFEEAVEDNNLMKFLKL